MTEHPSRYPRHAQRLRYYKAAEADFHTGESLSPDVRLPMPGPLPFEVEAGEAAELRVEPKFDRWSPTRGQYIETTQKIKRLKTRRQAQKAEEQYHIALTSSRRAEVLGEAEILVESVPEFFGEYTPLNLPIPNGDGGHEMEAPLTNLFTFNGDGAAETPEAEVPLNTTQ